ncbi:MAG: anthranilate synthase component II [Anaerolineales bacterium]
MLIVIDNYDSFTYNLVQYLGELKADIQVFRNDAITIEDLQELNPQQIVISPGPGTPAQAGITNDVIAQLGNEIPILGVCLGHQCIGEVFGAKVVRAAKPMHGKTSAIFHNDDPLFQGIPNPFLATRYHSLIVENIPTCLTTIAFTESGEVMALRHNQFPIYGVQFHPESILTEYGKMLLENFLNIFSVKPLQTSEMVKAEN